ncbi:MAG TPA: ATP-binding protein, partial [Acidimicrobiales bacterium]|nr:ATP-binding protein [Acidimicrobiales bacterium]
QGLGAPTGSALRAMLDASSSLLLACAADGRVHWCNDKASKVLVIEPTAIAVELRGFVHPDDVERLAGAIRRHAGAATPGSGPTGHDVPVRARVRHGSESWRQVDWILGTGRGPSKVVLLAGHDLTEHRAADAAVRGGEARVQAIIEHAPSALFVQDLDGRYLLLNSRWSQFAGKRVADMLGRTDEECLPDIAGRLADIRRTVIEATVPVTADVRVATPEGDRDLLVTVFALPDGNGDVYATCGLATDIGDRMRVAASVAERERVLQSVLEASPDVISTFDAEGSNLFADVHPEDFDEVASNFVRMATGSTTRARARYRVRDGRGDWVTMDSRWQAIADESGHFTGAVVVARDVSSRLQSELQLQELRRAAEEASSAKSAFLSRMSHELRTPLNSILGFAQLLEMDDLSVAQAEAVRHVLGGGRHLLEIIDDVLDISRLESGHLEMSSRPVQVRDVVLEALEDSESAAARAEVIVRTTIEPGDVTAVLADRRRLVQVLQNLISNAVKYNRPGGFVDVSCHASRSGRVRLAVADTGRGIRPEHLRRVFEPFERIGAEQSGIDGTGVGLTLSRKLAEAMGGVLEFESVLEVGSTFWVELPLAIAPDSPPPTRDRGGASAAPPFRVLLVEPDLSSLEIVERVLSRRPGVVVEGASQGKSALELARTRHPELILLDFQLPDMPATAVLQRLGEDEATSGIPVAMLSSGEGHGDSAGQMRRMLGRGVAGQVTKPIDVRALLSLVDAVRAASGR